MTRHLSFDELHLPESAIPTVAAWFERGDGLAVYENQDLGHPDLGSRKFVSFGSPQAQLEVETPPQQLPDIGGEINWRYRLLGIYRPEFDNEIKFATLHPGGTVTEQGSLTHAQVKNCPHLIISLSHYREDGTCRCDDPTSLEMAEWGYHWNIETNRWEGE